SPRDWEDDLCRKLKDYATAPKTADQDERGHWSMIKRLSRGAPAEACIESAELERLLLNSTGEAVYGLDMLGNCTFCNSACLRLLGYKDPVDLIGKNMH